MVGYGAPTLYAGVPVEKGGLIRLGDMMYRVMFRNGSCIHPKTYRVDLGFQAALVSSRELSIPR